MLFRDHRRCHAWVHWRLQHRLDMVIDNNEYQGHESQQRKLGSTAAGVELALW